MRVEFLHAVHVRGVQHHMAHLARLGPFGLLIMRERLGSETETAVVGVEHLETVSAGVVVKEVRFRERDAAARNDLPIECIHRCPVRHGKVHIFDAIDRPILKPVEKRLLAGTAQKRDTILLMGKAQAPHVLVKGQRARDAGSAHHDAAKAADANCLCHDRSSSRPQPTISASASSAAAKAAGAC